jgi:HSP20 family protein
MAQEQQQTSPEQEQQATPEQPVPQETQVKTEPQELQKEEQGQKATSIEPSEAKARPMVRPTRGALGRQEIWSHPFAFAQRMMDEMDRMFSRFGFGPSMLAPLSVFEPAREGPWVPSVETFERDGRLVLRADLPGLEQGDIKVEVVGDELVISGERKKEVERETAGQYYSERRYGSFERRMTLPVDCDPESIEATFENGVLEVSLAIPEQAPSKTRTIEVRSGHPEGGPRSIH